ncbi:heavy-metal-associated domain protein [Clostridium argentinense CDC 2741]|uniref:Heavy-metal-associated domain protein n=1 Tax=Clostridium argentinense CDC 2741 TaxID=1418104 RepID=A0A0C1U2E6_9CLOT|nr:cation transporter [Clostridium argentinense]ARC85435.1 heavy metal transport/detoxification protein [Clostridium argentinense]KIE47024.1 heavy-metal-associated domain protein [Clostridium argentinense CDC 2741]NFF41270.1 heavy metal transport/detoxification protein [Clostridium argentinense]NFP52330.1 heavy metal transport/detoxification protein [Clostridium argentinense]NFP71997.1 heavy metal transport/detoxification protein [Clostridium argentinense]
MKKKILVEGMKCENCAKHVKEALTNVEGVTNVDINLSDKYVLLDTAADVSDEAIKNAINTEKYNVIEIETL